MSDLISRSALIETMKKQWDMQDLYLPVHFIDFVEEQPPVKAVPLVYGEWTKSQEYAGVEVFTGKPAFICKHKCSVCHYQTGNQGRNFSFCPNCGADMRKKVE